MMLQIDTPLLIGQAARELGVEPWQLRRLFQRGLLPEAARVGVNRVVAPADLPAIKEALLRAGYLSQPVLHVGDELADSDEGGMRCR